MPTKAEIGKLPLEQQGILAQLELRKARHRQKLLEQARGQDWRFRYFPLYIFSAFFVFAVLYYFNFFHCQEKPDVCLLPIGMGLVFALVFHITRTNRRLDALLELLDLDREEQENRDNQPDSKVG